MRTRLGRHRFPPHPSTIPQRPMTFEKRDVVFTLDDLLKSNWWHHFVQEFDRLPYQQMLVLKAHLFPQPIRAAAQLVRGALGRRKIWNENAVPATIKINFEQREIYAMKTRRRLIKRSPYAQ